jgi:hypothetical protein
MKKLLWGLMVLPLLAASSTLIYAQEGQSAAPAAIAESTQSPLREDHPDSYVVVKGDTLWGISGRFLKSPWLWPEVWHANPQIENPHLIYPGDTVRLVYIDGKARLTVERGEASRTVKLSPGVRATPLESPISAIPLDSIAPFLTDDRIVDKGDYEKAPHLFAGGGQRVAMAAGDKVYARGNFMAGITTYGVYRQGEMFVDPITHERLGMEVNNIANGKIISKEATGDIVTMELTSAHQEALAGDKLLPTEESKVESTFFPSAPQNEIRGFILSVLSGVSQVGQYSVVAINKGAREGLVPGNTLAIYAKGEIVQDKETGETIKTPAEKAGLLMVFRIFDKVSYGIILNADRPLATMDEVRNP